MLHILHKDQVVPDLTGQMIDFPGLRHAGDAWLQDNKHSHHSQQLDAPLGRSCFACDKEMPHISTHLFVSDKAHKNSANSHIMCVGKQLHK